MSDTANANEGGTPRERVVAALMGLLADKGLERIDLPEVAERAGVTLAEFRKAFSSLPAVLAAFASDMSDIADESPRERLFDILMRRLELLAPHKDALRSVVRSARFNPPLAMALNLSAARSQSWMLSAAGISTAGLRGAIRSQGMACLYADVMRTWLRDDDPGLARTMAELDRQLGRGAWWAGRLDDLCRLVPTSCGRDRWRPRSERDAPSAPGEQPAVV
ncbi:MAG: TetR/AcrR family transcriptional regulator [Rhizobiales bacterium]|nr:TetR/AcrR family transcriptional regulator [Hyphomicrobiales bacterium]